MIGTLTAALTDVFGTVAAEATAMIASRLAAEQDLGRIAAEAVRLRRPATHPGT